MANKNETPSFADFLSLLFGGIERSNEQKRIAVLEQMLSYTLHKLGGSVTTNDQELIDTIRENDYSGFEVKMEGDSYCFRLVTRTEAQEHREELERQQEVNRAQIESMFQPKQ